MKQRIINWKTFFILLAASVIAGMLQLPYLVALEPETAELGAILYISTFVTNLVLFSVVIFVGLLLAPKVGFTLPVIEGPNRGETLKAILLPSVIIGLLCGVAVVLLNEFVLLPLSASVPIGYVGYVDIPTWKRVLAI